MTILSAATPASGPAVTRREPGVLTQFTDLLRSEFCKLRSVRSTFWTLTATLVFNVAIAALAAVFIPPNLDAADVAQTDAVRLSLAGLHLSQIAIGVLGALVITSEYGTGMIRATFAAVPQRRLVLAAKAEYGKSVTDACVDLPTTESMLAELAEATRARRGVSVP